MTERLTDFRQLNVWQKAHKLVLEIYELTKKYPKDEKTEMAARLRESATKIPIMIASGFMRRKPIEKETAYKETQDWIEEVKYLLILSSELEYVKDVEELILATEEVGRMLTGLVRSVKGNH